MGLGPFALELFEFTRCLVEAVLDMRIVLVDVIHKSIDSTDARFILFWCAVNQSVGADSEFCGTCEGLNLTKRSGCLLADLDLLIMVLGSCHVLLEEWHLRLYFMELLSYFLSLDISNLLVELLDVLAEASNLVFLNVSVILIPEDRSWFLLSNHRDFLEDVFESSRSVRVSWW